MSTPSEPGAGQPLDPKKLLREAIAGGDSELSSGGWQPPTVAELGERFPELDVVELIGRGGMGAVYRVVQRKLDRTVALKVLPPELAQDPAFEERFLREARALAGLKHERILTVHDFGERQGLYYLVTEFVEGMNLRQLMDMGELSPHEALRITPQICEALQYAHDHGVVHRDIKPENLLIDLAGEVRIADFGLARIVSDNPDAIALTRSTQVLGTPQYMAPEQWRDGQNVDHRADIYAVGVVLYEMLTGQLPMGHFEPPSQRDGVPRGLDAIVQRSLAQKPEQRYQRASEVGEELTRHAVAAPPSASKPVDSRSLRDPAQQPAPTVKAAWAPPISLIVAWSVVLFSIAAVVIKVQQVQAELLVYDIAYEDFQRVEEAAHKWAHESNKDIGAGNVLQTYFESQVWPDWERRRTEAAQAGSEFTEARPIVPTEPVGPSKLAFSQLLPLALLPLTIFMMCGFAAVRRIRNARRGAAWLGASLFTAWIVPIIMTVFTPFVLMRTLWSDSADHGNWAFLAGVLLAFPGIAAVIRHHGRLTKELTDQSG